MSTSRTPAAAAAVPDDDDNAEHEPNFQPEHFDALQLAKFKKGKSSV